MMSLAGFIVAGFSFLLGAWYMISKLAGVAYNPGLPTTVLVVSFFSGVQLLSLGLMGEYVGRIYDEVKRRPKYIIDHEVNADTLVTTDRVAEPAHVAAPAPRLGVPPGD